MRSAIILLWMILLVCWSETSAATSIRIFHCTLSIPDDFSLTFDGSNHLAAEGPRGSGSIVLMPYSELVWGNRTTMPDMSYQTYKGLLVRTWKSTKKQIPAMQITDKHAAILFFDGAVERWRDYLQSCGENEAIDPPS